MSYFYQDLPYSKFNLNFFFKDLLVNLFDDSNKPITCNKIFF